MNRPLAFLAALLLLPLCAFAGSGFTPPSSGGSVGSSNLDAVTITPNDHLGLSNTTTALYVSGSGNISVVTPSGNTLVFSNVPSGSTLPVAATQVTATNTTATGIIGLLPSVQPYVPVPWAYQFNMAAVYSDTGCTVSATSQGASVLAWADWNSGVILRSAGRPPTIDIVNGRPYVKFSSSNNTSLYQTGSISVPLETTSLVMRWKYTTPADSSKVSLGSFIFDFGKNGQGDSGGGVNVKHYGVAATTGNNGGGEAGVQACTDNTILKLSRWASVYSASAGKTYMHQFDNGVQVVDESFYNMAEQNWSTNITGTSDTIVLGDGFYGTTPQDTSNPTSSGDFETDFVGVLTSAPSALQAKAIDQGMASYTPSRVHVCEGDSLTEGIQAGEVDYGPIGVYARQTYCPYYYDIAPAQLQALRPTLMVLNKAIYGTQLVGGATGPSCTARESEVAASLHSGDTLSVLIGSNDIAAPISTSGTAGAIGTGTALWANIQAYTSYYRALGVKVYVGTLLPRSVSGIGESWSSGTAATAEIAGYNAGQAAFWSAYAASGSCSLSTLTATYNAIAAANPAFTNPVTRANNDYAFEQQRQIVNAQIRASWAAGTADMDGMFDVGADANIGYFGANWNSNYYLAMDATHLGNVGCAVLANYLNAVLP